MVIKDARTGLKGRPRPHLFALPKPTKKAYLRRGHKNAKHGAASVLNVNNKTRAALDFRIMGYSEHDIAKSLGITQGRVSQLLKDAFDALHEQNAQYTEVLLDMELERIDRMILAWFKAAQKDPRSAEVLHKWVERRHKLLGLEITKSELTGKGGGPLHINASSLDITKLDGEELMWLERIVKKAGPQLAALTGPV